MPETRLKFGDRELLLRDGVTTIGRVPDNAVSFPEDANVSRFHAEIESSGDEHRLIDLDSSNGTTVNGQPVKGAVFLADGDEIVLGGSSTIIVEKVKDVADALDSAGAAAPAGASGSAGAGSSAAPNLGSSGGPNLPAVQIASPESLIARDTAAASKGGTGLLIAGAAVCCLVVLLTVGAVAYYVTRPAACEATARIVSPEAGETLKDPTDIEIDVENGACVGRAVFMIDGVEFASADEPPFSVSIDPKEFPELADGFDHSLTVVLKDEEGKVINQPPPLPLAFDTRAVAKPSTERQVLADNSQPQQQKVSKTTEPTLLDVQKMSTQLVKQFSGNFSYNVSNKQFLQEVQKRTAEYAQEGYYERAARYRDAINVAYVRENNLEAALGFILAMSRSKFSIDRQGESEGLWRMTNAFVTENAYNGSCGAETLSDPSQNCAAKASALYMKTIVFTVFEGDPILSAVVFGKSPADAVAWKSSLPQNRVDLWNAIKTPQEREQLVRFFAAGIVAENPQKFGLKKDRPLSELYKLTM